MIKIDHATFTYGENNEYSVGIRDIDLEIEDGQVIVLCGESGCGKTTLTRMINGLIPHYYEGKLTGEIWINGINVSQQPLYDTAKIVGSVFQNPRSQFFNVDTTSEIIIQIHCMHIFIRLQKKRILKKNHLTNC